jgi:hypothetical protein
MSNDSTPYEVMDALNVGMVEVVTVIVVEKEAITLVAQYQRKGFSHWWAEHTCAEPCLIDVILEE